MGEKNLWLLEEMSLLPSVLRIRWANLHLTATAWGRLSQASLHMSLQQWLTGPFYELGGLGNPAENQTSRGGADSYLPVGLLSKITNDFIRHHSWRKGEDRKSKAASLGSCELSSNHLFIKLHSVVFPQFWLKLPQGYCHLILSKLFSLLPLYHKHFSPKKAGCSSTQRRTRTQ